MNKDHFVIVMAGGVGTRFWPVSRTTMPKQFLDIIGTGKTLIQATYDRLKSIVPVENIFIVTNEKYKSLVTDQLSDLLVENILLEPMAKNTAACIAYGLFKIQKLNPNAKVAITPSDHLITEETQYFNCIKNALEFTHQYDAIVTLGIKPTRPDTGYGYIQTKTPETDFEKNLKQMFRVKTFTEKPTLEIAQTFLDSGEYLWNGGIFISNVSFLLKEIELYLPEVYELFFSAKKYYWTEKEQSYIQKIYPQCHNISIDIGVIEKAENVFVIPADFGWSDLGTWKSIHEILPSDEANNVEVGGKVFKRNSKGCIIYNNSDKLTVLQGVNDLVIAITDDVILIADRNNEQDIKIVFSDIKIAFNNLYN